MINNVAKIKFNHGIKDGIQYTSNPAPKTWITKMANKEGFDSGIKYARWLDDQSKLKKEKRAYYKEVMRLTESVKHLLPDIHLRSWTGYHIDHKISLRDGFKLGIPPEIIGGLDNLRLIPYKENLKKGTKSIW